MASLKLRYEVDPHNRLVVSETGQSSALTRFRRVFDGRFKLGPGNSLIYHIKGPMYGLKAQAGAAHQVKLRGKWSLNKNHDLVLTLDKWRRQTFGDQLTLQGKLLQAEANALLFAVTTRSAKGLDSRYILRLQGIWQADRRNRLSFRVKKAKGRHDTLILDGIWEINKHHRIVYTYEKARLLTKERLQRTLAFKGFWDIARRNRLSYELSRYGKSAFYFRTGAGLLAKNYIKYELGIGISGRKHPLRRILVLYGRWKIKRDAGLLFEIEYEQGKAKAIKFGADAKLNKQDNIEFRLKNELKKDLGLELKLSRKLLQGDGEAFFKLLKDKKEASVYAGAAWRW
jgi:hypothetical protein